MSLAPFNLKAWIDEHRHLLKPPVGNQCIVDGDFIVMIIGGPNSRKDFHWEDGPEFFYQIEGDITVRVIEHGAIRDIVIREGDVFYLPPRTPHSPQRPANTIGLVVERKRMPGELDAFQWYCENCDNLLYSETMELVDIVNQLPPVFERYYKNLQHRTCAKCGTVQEPPARVPDRK